MTSSKRIREKPGQVLRVPLPDGTSAFALVLPDKTTAFFDCRSAGDERPPLEEILAARVLFRTFVMKYAVTKGVWPVVGDVSPPPELLVPAQFFKQDPLNGELTVLSGEVPLGPATSAECLHMERYAVWDPEHIVSRLVDHFAGRPNKWVESMRPRARRP